MTLLVAWVAFPALLVLLSIGCGLLLRAVSGSDLPAALVPAAGLAVIVVVTGFLTLDDATTEFSTPVVLALAVAGLILSVELRPPDLSCWELLAAAGVFAVFAAPVVLSGDATFAGYIKLDDTATWMAFVDHLMEHGRSASGLAPSTYEATIDVNLPQGYPVGAFLPLGAPRPLVGQDVAWLVQPYMATLAAMLALVLAWIARPLLASARANALVAFIAAQPALLFAYALWGGIKEVAAALLIALVAATAASFAADGPLRRLLVPAVAAAALLVTVGAGGAVWLAAIAIPAAILAWRVGVDGLMQRAVVLGGLTLAASASALVSGKFFSPTQGALVNDSELGNLLGPLNLFQVVGIWPVGDFRLRPDEMLLTYVLIGVAIALVLVCIWAAVRFAADAVTLYGVGALGGALVIVIVASPWVDAKALASVAPAALLLACVGAVFLWDTEARVFAAVALAAIAIGVVWSNLLAYRNVNLAPREQLAELERIGEQIEGEGPTLTTDSEVYGGRHFLRRGNPENSTDLRRSTIPLVGGGLPDEVPSLDTDQLQLDALLTYRTLVLRRSPVHSRPPSPYRLVDSGRFYDVWQRPAADPGIQQHLGLGDELSPTAVPACAEVLGLASRARERGAGARLVAATQPPVTVIDAAQTTHPPEWESQSEAGSLLLTSSGDLRAQFSFARPGRYEIWLGGSARGAAEVSVDGREVGGVSGQLANAGEYTDLGSIHLRPGAHRLLMHYDSRRLSPGIATPPELPYPSLPLVVSSGPADPRVVQFDPGDARELCRRRWDWIEAVGG